MQFKMVIVETLTREEFFHHYEMQGALALTYGDVRLRTMHSEVLPYEVGLKSMFSKRVPLNIPIVAAAMDSVTESGLAIALAMEGGLGIIHKNLTAEEQAEEVGRVKHFVHALIKEPKYVYQDDLLASILRMREEKNFGFHSFPVLDEERKLVGILTSNDFDFCNKDTYLARDIMTPDLITASAGTGLDEVYELMFQHKKKHIPLVDDDGRLAGLYVFSDVHGIKSGNSEIFNVDENGQLIVGAAIGVGEDAFTRLEKLAEENVNVVVIDTAHGDTKSVIETLKKIKSMNEYKNIDVVVGNVSEPESAKRLADEGADGVKVGQGPGSICTTRIISGVGCPQLTAVYNCARAVEEYKIPICADGGIKHSGDIPVAIGALAQSVMIGSLLAGTKETPGEIFFSQGRQWKDYRGMGSMGAMQEHQGSRDRYGQEAPNKLVPEGIEGIVPYRGPLSEVVFQLIGGLRSGMGYLGAKDIGYLRENANFRRSTKSGQDESHPHGVVITKDAPNYTAPR